MIRTAYIVWDIVRNCTHECTSSKLAKTSDLRSRELTKSFKHETSEMPMRVAGERSVI